MLKDKLHVYLQYAERQKKIKQLHVYRIKLSLESRIGQWLNLNQNNPAVYAL